MNIEVDPDNSSANALSPPRSDWDSVFKQVVSGAADAPCSAPVLGRARLKPDGLGSRLNQFANEIVLAMHHDEPVALCAPAAVRDTWAVYFQDPGFPRCDSCDFRGSTHNDAWQQGWWASGNLDHTWVDSMKHFLYSRLFRLTADMQSAVDQQRQSLGIDGSAYVGVHVRRGDKITEVPHTPIEQYADAVARLCEQVGAKKVFLASDDDSIFGELQEVLRQTHEFELVQQPRLPADAYKLRGGPARMLQVANAVEEAERNILVDVGILAHADGFVGTASSGIGRFVYFMRDPASPAVSLDEHGDFLHVPGF